MPSISTFFSTIQRALERAWKVPVIWFGVVSLYLLITLVRYAMPLLKNPPEFLPGIENAWVLAGLMIFLASLPAFGIILFLRQWSLLRRMFTLSAAAILLCTVFILVMGMGLGLALGSPKSWQKAKISRQTYYIAERAGTLDDDNPSVYYRLYAKTGLITMEEVASSERLYRLREDALKFREKYVDLDDSSTVIYMKGAGGRFAYALGTRTLTQAAAVMPCRSCSRP